MTDLRYKEIRGITWGLLFTVIACTVTLLYKGGKWYTGVIIAIQENKSTNDLQNTALKNHDEQFRKTDERFNVIEQRINEHDKRISENEYDIVKLQYRAK